ncbi:MAG: 4-(cytidine 5'-diphospho)-2-C-methyl-D-erythritol kinase [Pseudomonadota bacterium]
MTKVEAFAPAKLNLTLHVTGQRADGYHLLDSVVVFADIGDRLTLRPYDVMSINVTGPFAPGVPTDARNLAWRAAEAAGVSCEITLDKVLPHAAGIGGGSSDAAAVLRCADGLGGQVPSDVAALGADVPVCMTLGAQRMSGIGDMLSRLTLPKAWLVLVTPDVKLATAPVFEALETKTNPPMAEIGPFNGFYAFVAWLKSQRNDLEPPARALVPEISEALAALANAPVARMSGSGPTCFGVFPSDDVARAAARRIAEQHPSWWVQAARMIA